jgi:hypothetical protein
MKEHVPGVKTPIRLSQLTPRLKPGPISEATARAKKQQQGQRRQQQGQRRQQQGQRSNSKGKEATARAKATTEIMSGAQNDEPSKGAAIWRGREGERE